MNSEIIITVAVVVVAIVLSYTLLWFKKHQTKIAKEAQDGNFLAFSLQILDGIVEDFVFDLKDSGQKGRDKKEDVKVKVKTFYADHNLPTPPDSAISGAIERGVSILKAGDKNNVKNG